VPDADKPTLLVIDGHSLAFRAFYALPVDSFSTRDGQHTNAIHGFLSMLLLLLQNEKPTHLAVAFDMSRQSFRTREYAESSPSIVTPLNRYLGYEEAASIAKQSLQERKTIREVVLERGHVDDGTLTLQQLDAALDVLAMTGASKRG